MIEILWQNIFHKLMFDKDFDLGVVAELQNWTKHKKYSFSKIPHLGSFLKSAWGVIDNRRKQVIHDW